MLYIVTIKIHNPKHNPHEKQIGECHTSIMCTDKTGHHHSIVVDAEDIEEAKQIVHTKFQHITRIELVSKVMNRIGEYKKNEN